jgi:predicted O-methyltransferase YrrM
MTCVDSFDFGGQAVTMDASNLQDRFDRNIEAAGLRDRVEKKSGSSQVVLRTLPLESYDYIYIDGSHLAPDVLEDTILCFRLVKVGGIITFDDYGFQPNARPVERPTIAIDAFLACFAEKVEVIYKGYQLSIRRLS